MRRVTNWIALMGLLALPSAVSAADCSAISDPFQKAQCATGNISGTGALDAGGLAPKLSTTPQYSGSAGCTDASCAGAAQSGYYNTTGDMSSLNAAGAGASTTDPNAAKILNMQSSAGAWNLSTSAPIASANTLASSFIPLPGTTATCVDTTTCIEYTTGSPSIVNCTTPGTVTQFCDVTDNITVQTASLSAGAFPRGPVPIENAFCVKVVENSPGNYTIWSVDCGTDHSPPHCYSGDHPFWFWTDGVDVTGTLPPSSTVLSAPNSTFTFSAAGPGCDTNTLSVGPGQFGVMCRVTDCNAPGRQTLSWAYSYSSAFDYMTETIADGCAPLEADPTAVVQSSVCLDGAARTFTALSGMVYPFTRCWDRRDEYIRTAAGIDTCDPYRSSVSCQQTNSVCTDVVAGRCAMYTNVFSCDGSPVCTRTQTVHQCNQCGVPGSIVPFCMPTGAPANTNFQLAATYMSLIEDVQNDFDPANLKIFTGMAKVCSYSTIATSLVDCCSTDPSQLIGSCNPGEIDLANDRRAKKAHYVGTFCSSYVSLGLGRVCVENEEVWCSFKSELGRIVQEQGRPQLGIAWGAAKTPNCDGFTVTQFGSLNFASMDLSEFYASITTNMDSAAIGTKMHEKACLFKTGSPSC